jgi:hypothetical protein
MIKPNNLNSNYHKPNEEIFELGYSLEEKTESNINKEIQTIKRLMAILKKDMMNTHNDKMNESI